VGKDVLGILRENKRALKRQIADLNKRAEKVREKLITEEEFTKLLKVVDNMMYKTLLCFLYEMGTRIAEAVTVRLRDLEITDQFIRVRINGKTGMRTVYVISFSGVLQTWINMHPARNDPNAYLFYSRSEGVYKLFENTRNKNAYKILHKQLSKETNELVKEAIKESIMKIECQTLSLIP